MKRNSSRDRFHNEEELVSFLRKKIPRFGSGIGIGDDAAVVGLDGSTVVTTDSLVEHVHFRREWVTPLYLGKKAARSNLSDIAAMGASPKYALVSLVLPGELFAQPFISQLYDGLLWAFKPHAVEIVGGNVSSGRDIAITITLMGAGSSRVLTREGAKPGDLICCTGQLGKAASEISELYAGDKNQMTVVPPDRVIFARQLAVKNLATACIDISDGLSRDLARLCTASSVGATVTESLIPSGPGKKLTKQKLSYALNGGEDYELLFTVPQPKKSRLFELASEFHVPIVCFGEINSETNRIGLLSEEGKITNLDSRGWDHLTL